MKYLMFCILSILLLTVNAQEDCLFPEIQKGTEWTITNYDKKGRVESSSQNFIKDVKSNGSAVEYLVAAKIYDKKDAEMSEAEMTMICDNGVFKMDLTEAIPAATLEGMQSMDMTISGDNLQYPVNLSVGQELPNSLINLKASSGGMTLMDMNVSVTDRKVEAYETITVPAGEFKCYKISSTTTVRTRILNIQTTDVQWYTPGIGVIKTQYYDKKGRENGHSELTAFKKG